MVVWVVWGVATLFWSSMRTTNIEHHSSPEIVNNKASYKNLNIDVISKLNLFGMFNRANNKQINTVKSTIKAPETKLKLKLVGLRRSSGTLKSSAIVESSNKAQAIYFIGDKLPSGGAIVDDILVKHMVISRNGKLETLTLFSELNTKSVIKQNNSRSAKVNQIDHDLSTNQLVTGRLTKFRNMALKDPLALNGVVNIQPLHRDGTFQGYTLTPGKDSEFFKESGLKSGDVLTSLNEIELDNPNKVLSLMGILATATDLGITVSRDGRPISFKYKFK